MGTPLSASSLATARSPLPVRNQDYFLTLSMQEAEVAEPCVTQQGITLQVRAVIAFKVGDDNESIANAGRRFLDDQKSCPSW